MNRLLTALHLYCPEIIRARLLVAICGLIVFGSSDLGNAGVITLTPTDLTPGDSYRLAFVTSTTTAATSTEINTYNSFVDAIGDTVLPGDWRVIGSTGVLDAKDNTNTNSAIDGTGVPIYLLNDTRIANDYVDLWDGSIITPLRINENGDIAPILNVHTGTNTNGTGFASSQLGMTTVERGGNYNSNFSWISFNDPLHNTINRPLYAMSEVLNVASVPEPSSFLLLGILTGGAYVRRRLKHLRAP